MIKTVKKIQTALANKLVLIAVAVFGVGIVTFCSASDECTPSITLSTSMNSGCGTVNVTSTTTCDDQSDAVTCSGGGATNTIPFYDEDTDETLNWDGNPTIITLAAGLNRLKANSSELSMSSSEVDINSQYASGPTYSISVNQDCNIPGDYVGAQIPFTFCCLDEGEDYNWHEDVSRTSATGDCTSVGCNTGLGSDYPFQGDGQCDTVPDKDMTPNSLLASGPFYGTWTCHQNWSLDGDDDGTVFNDTSGIDRTHTLAGRTLTLAVSGSANGSASCTYTGP